MIKPVDEIPQSLASKRKSYREQIRNDIKEAMDKDIRKFEFVGDYKYKYLANYAREEADRIIHNEYLRTIKKRSEELEDAHYNYYKIQEKIKSIITVTAVRGEDKDHPRVFCEIAESPEDIIMNAILEYDNTYKELEKARAEREEKRRKLIMEANDKTESFDFQEELP